MLICLLPKPPIDFFSIKKKIGSKKNIFVVAYVADIHEILAEKHNNFGFFYKNFVKD
jgi:hypothetical protein